MTESQSPEPGQQPVQAQDSKGKRVLISMLVGTFAGGVGGVAAFVVTLGLIVLLVMLLNRAEPGFFMLLALPFYFSLPVSLIITLLVGLSAWFFTYKKGLPWFNARDRRTRRRLFIVAVIITVMTGACAAGSLVAYARPILSVLM